MPCFTSSSCIHLVVGTTELLNILVYGVYVRPQPATAISTVEQITKHILWSIIRFRCSAFGFLGEFLYRFKGFTVNYRLVNILAYRPIFFGVRDTGFVLK